MSKPFDFLVQGPFNKKNAPETRRKNEFFKNAYYHILWEQGACTTRGYANVPVEKLRKEWPELTNSYWAEQLLWMSGWIKDRERFMVNARKCAETMLESLHLKDGWTARDVSRVEGVFTLYFIKMFFPELPPLNPVWLKENGYHPDGSPNPEAVVTAAPEQKSLPQPVAPKPPEEAKQHAEPVVEAVGATPPLKVPTVEETPLQPRRDEKGRIIDRLGRPNGGNPKQHREKGKFASLKEAAKAIAPDLVESQPSPELPNVLNEGATA